MLLFKEVNRQWPKNLIWRSFDLLKATLWFRLMVDKGKYLKIQKMVITQPYNLKIKFWGILFSQTLRIWERKNWNFVMKSYGAIVIFLLIVAKRKHFKTVQMAVNKLYDLQIKKWRQFCLFNFKSWSNYCNLTFWFDGHLTDTMYMGYYFRHIMF